MATAPTSIDVLVIPTDGGPVYIDTLGTIKVNDLRSPPSAPITAPYDLLQSLKQELLKDSSEPWGAGDDMVYCVHKCQLQPRISLQPNTGIYWSRSSVAWEDRAVLGDIKYHVFFTTSSDEELEINSLVSRDLRGDVFLLKLSNTVNENGLRSYVDFEDEMPESDGVSLKGYLMQVAQFVEDR